MSYLNLTPDDLNFQQKKDNHISKISVFKLENSKFLQSALCRRRRGSRSSPRYCETKRDVPVGAGQE